MGRAGNPLRILEATEAETPQSASRYDETVRCDWIAGAGTNHNYNVHFLGRKVEKANRFIPNPSFSDVPVFASDGHTLCFSMEYRFIGSIG